MDTLINRNDSMRVYKVVCSMAWLKDQEHTELFKSYKLWEEKNILKHFYVFRKSIIDAVDVSNEYVDFVVTSPINSRFRNQSHVRVYYDDNDKWIWTVELSTHLNEPCKSEKIEEVLSLYKAQILETEVITQVGLKANIQQDSTMVL